MPSPQSPLNSSTGLTKSEGTQVEIKKSVDHMLHKNTHFGALLKPSNNVVTYKSSVFKRKHGIKNNAMSLFLILQFLICSIIITLLTIFIIINIVESEGESHIS